MSDEVTTPADVSPVPTPPPAQAGETDWKAEARKWEQRAKENREAVERLAELEASQKAAEATYAEQLKALEASQQVAALDRDRYRIAAAKGLDPELLGSVDEDGNVSFVASTSDGLAAYADKLAQFLESRVPAKTVVPGLGSTPPAAPSVDEQIRSAEAAGDVGQSLGLKLAKLSQLRDQA